MTNNPKRYRGPHTVFKYFRAINLPVTEKVNKLNRQLWTNFSDLKRKETINIRLVNMWMGS